MCLPAQGPKCCGKLNIWCDKPIEIGTIWVHAVARLGQSSGESNGAYRRVPGQAQRLETTMSTADWTPEKIATLIALWNENLTTSEIGRRLGITKNAVIGKVHRLGLPQRRPSLKDEPEAADIVRLESWAPTCAAGRSATPATELPLLWRALRSRASPTAPSTARWHTSAPAAIGVSPERIAPVVHSALQGQANHGLSVCLRRLDAYSHLGRGVMDHELRRQTEGVLRV